MVYMNYALTKISMIDFLCYCYRIAILLINDIIIMSASITLNKLIPANLAAQFVSCDT